MKVLLWPYLENTSCYRCSGNEKVKFEQELRGGEEVSLSVGAMFQREVTVVQMKKPYNETILAGSKAQQRGHHS